MTIFERCFADVIGHEGGFDATSADPGNWTGGAVGSGALRGTNWGIASSAYADQLRALPDAVRATMPDQVRDLTLDQARTIYRAVYWNRIQGDALPPQLALLIFDAAINNGIDRGTRFLQQAVSAYVDGDLGPQTLAATRATVAAKGLQAVCTEVQAQRLVFMASLSTWPTFALGWARRLCALPYQSLTITT